MVTVKIGKVGKVRRFLIRLLSGREYTRDRYGYREHIIRTEHEIVALRARATVSRFLDENDKKHVDYQKKQMMEQIVEEAERQGLFLWETERISDGTLYTVTAYIARAGNDLPY